MKKNIIIALSIFAIFAFIPFQAVAVQKLVSNKVTAINQPSSKTVILSKPSLSNWNQTRIKSIGLASQMKVLPKKKNVMINLKKLLNGIDELMQRVANPVENKSALRKALSGLRNYEKQIKGMQHEIEFLYQEQGTSGDDGQLDKIKLQSMLQMQQHLIQMMSQVSKVLHDTALAVIRKIG